MILMPTFCFHTREPEYKTVYPADVILFEGILVLYNKDIRNLLNMKIFVDTDSDTRLARRGMFLTLIISIAFSNEGKSSRPKASNLLGKGATSVKPFA